MVVSDMPPPEARMFQGVIVRAAVPARPGHGERPELDDEPPPRFDVYHLTFARQIVVATSSVAISGQTELDGGILSFQQVPARHGLPYTYVYFGTTSPRSASI
jgi:hypothetical protein